MKKVISGRRYDTETAKKVGEAGYSNCSDFHYWSEELYVKRTGEYFIHGQGGPMSSYNQKVGQNEWTGGQEIIPLSLEEAQEWVEKYLGADEYEALFGKVEEDKVQVNCWIDEKVKAEADMLKGKGYTQSDIFEAGVKALMEERQGK